MLLIVLKDAARSIVNKHKPLRPADVGQSQRTHDISADGLNPMGLAPIDVRPAGDTGGVEHVRRLDCSQVRLQRCSVFEPPGAVLVRDPLAGAELAKQASDPSRPAIDEELVLGAVRRRRCHRRRVAGISLKLAGSGEDAKGPRWVRELGIIIITSERQSAKACYSYTRFCGLEMCFLMQWDERTVTIKLKGVEKENGGGEDSKGHPDGISWYLGDSGVRLWHVSPAES